MPEMTMAKKGREQVFLLPRLSTVSLPDMLLYPGAHKCFAPILLQICLCTSIKLSELRGLSVQYLVHLLGKVVHKNKINVKNPW